jgi:hypothetical protein
MTHGPLFQCGLGREAETIYLIMAESRSVVLGATCRGLGVYFGGEAAEFVKGTIASY